MARITYQEFLDDEHVNPEFKAAVRRAVEAYIAAGNSAPSFDSTYRTPEHQAQLYADHTRNPVDWGGVTYRPDPNNRVGLAAPPGRSRHNSGSALDITDDGFQRFLVNSGGDFGLSQLGNENARRNDPGHWQLAGSGGLPAAQGAAANWTGQARSLAANVMEGDQPVRNITDWMRQRHIANAQSRADGGHPILEGIMNRMNERKAYRAEGGKPILETLQGRDWRSFPTTQPEEAPVPGAPTATPSTMPNPMPTPMPMPMPGSPGNPLPRADRDPGDEIDNAYLPTGDDPYMESIGYSRGGIVGLVQRYAKGGPVGQQTVANDGGQKRKNANPVWEQIPYQQPYTQPSTPSISPTPGMPSTPPAPFDFNLEQRLQAPAYGPRNFAPIVPGTQSQSLVPRPFGPPPVSMDFSTMNADQLGAVDVRTLSPEQRTEWAIAYSRERTRGN